TNISIEGGARVEVKNINSIKGAYRAIKFEVMRQKAKLDRGETVTRETRAYLESQRITMPMRAKELEEDYRYIPDPDIFPLIIDEARVGRIRASMAEPPHLRERRLVEQYGIEPSTASVIVSERELADLFEAVAASVNPKLTAGWFRTKLKKVLNYMKLRAADVRFTPGQMVELLRMVEGGELTPEQGELVLRELVKKPDDPRRIAWRLGLERIGVAELRAAVAEAIKTNQEAVRDYLAGKHEALHFLAGRVMELTRGRADPRKVIELLRAELEGGGAGNGE
ncbi:MAG: hypothetical protein QXP65_02375, partial [Candidatus Hadarchaeales archaeon]